ncbi:MAG: hypothetical protein WC774_01735 [Candidatus Gracilibacteria bacterium]
MLVSCTTLSSQSSTGSTSTEKTGTINSEVLLPPGEMNARVIENLATPEATGITNNGIVPINPVSNVVSSESTESISGSIVH